MEYPEIIDTTPKTFVILGCKRGGTSFIAQILGDNGVDIKTCDNGHNEDIGFTKLNNKILNEAGGDWDNIPSKGKLEKAVKNNEKEIKELLAKRKTRMWGWKDPRQAALIEYYLPYLEDDVYLVCVFRKPDMVAKSMNRIWNTDIKEGKKLAKVYYERLIDGIKKFI